MSKKHLSLITLAVLLLTMTTSFADVLTPTLTKVYFYKDGKQFDGEVKYTVDCFGYNQGFDEAEKVTGSYTPEVVYSYSATCPSFGCNVYENYYTNYKHIDYCDLTGTAEEKEFSIKKFADYPIKECKNLHQWSTSTGDKYYKYTDEYRTCQEEKGYSDDTCDQYLKEIPDSELIKNPEDQVIDEECEARFDITKGTYFVDGIFHDVSQMHDNYDAIKYMKELGIVSGNPDGTFKPSSEINRAEFTKIIINAMMTTYSLNDQIPSELTDADTCKKTFKDVSNDKWFYKYVCKSTNIGFVDGYTDGTFRPNDSISFTEASKMIVEALKVDHNTAATGEKWYETYVKALQDKRAIPSNIYKLEDKITRGDMSEMIYRVLADITDKNFSELL